MYQHSYEDYMRMVLGYQPTLSDGSMNCNTYQDFVAPFNMENNMVPTLEDLYPNIFHILNPIVEKVCQENTKPMCKEVLEDMTEKIYHIVEEREETASMPETNTTVKNTEMRTSKSREDGRLEDKRKNNNFLLRDLIKILILNQILNQNRPPRPGPRPPFPGPHPRPPRPRIYDYM